MYAEGTLKCRPAEWYWPRAYNSDFNGCAIIKPDDVEGYKVYAQPVPLFEKRLRELWDERKLDKSVFQLGKKHQR